MKKDVTSTASQNFILKLYTKSIDSSDTWINKNINEVNYKTLLAPLLLLFVIIFCLFSEDALSVDNYTGFQKKAFLYLNAHLSQLPDLQYNLTQLGDCLILVPFITLCVVFAPKSWQSLITSLIVSALFSNILKKLFAIPRPARLWDNKSFVIIGETLKGYNSLPSGHSIATFTVLIIVLIAFMPKKSASKIIWKTLIITAGLIIALSRVGVGAHYPIDVLIGSLIGFISAIIGILITRKINLWKWMTTRRYYPLTIFLFTIWAIVLIVKLVALNLVIIYLSLISLLISISTITYIYVQKKH